MPKFTDEEIECGCQNWEEEIKGVGVFKEDRVSVGEEEKVLGGDSSEGSTLLGRYSVLLRHNGVD